MEKKSISGKIRILAISLSSTGFGYAVMEGNDQLVGYGKMVIKKNKSARVLVHTGKIVSRYQPNVLVLQDVNAKGAYRHQRIKKLHRRITARAKKRKIKVVEISGKELRNTLLGDTAGTKQEMAELLAKRFPDELASRLPTKRKAWTSEDSRMDIFDAVGIVLAHQQRNK
jgi:hypothetical protein